MDIRNLFRRNIWNLPVVAISAVIILVGVLMVFGQSSLTYVIIIGILGIVFLVLLVWSYIRARALKKKKAELEAEDADIVGLPTKYQYKDLEAATGNFQTLVGIGGSGSVFKGTLGTDGSHIAVKRINEEGQGRREFKSEVATLARIQHSNLVHLLGYCLGPKGFRYIVYEYIPKGSLATWIFEEDNTTDKWLSWAVRYQIAIDVASGLSYLHHDCHTKILHRDIKPDNILIDEEFRARVSDFGLSRLLGRNEGEVCTTIKGTYSYIAPEWHLPNGTSEKSDVFSYGVVLLELVVGRRNLRVIDDGSDIPKWDFRFPKEAFEKMREGKILDLVAERLVEGWDFKEEELKVLVGVGLLCMQTKPEHRPSMTDVLGMLEKRVPVDIPPENRMYITNFAADVPVYSPEDQHPTASNVLLSSS